MNVYDFDGTIYAGDSTIDFYFHALKKSPRILRFIPKQILGIILYVIKRIDKTTLKSYFFCFLTLIDVEKTTSSFWTKNENKILLWYKRQQQPDDIIISASPEFLLRPICKKLGIRHLIASRVDENSGMFVEPNCYGIVKVQRFYDNYGNSNIENFYSDSLSDAPLANIAANAFLIRNGTITTWPQ